MKKLVILGGGYGGMRLIQRLSPKQLPEDVEITLIDKVPYHCLKTEFYALAAGTLSDHHVRVRFPEHVKLNVVYGEVEKVDLESRLIILKDQDNVSYDDLVIGLGCENNYHNVPGASQYTYGIQSIKEARKTYAALNNLPGNSRVAIIGAGLSGVELASELFESRPDLDIYLFDRGSRILSSYPEKISTFVTDWFNEHHIHIVSHSNITKVEEGILYNNDEPLEFDVVVWTAGIQANRIVRDMPIEKDPHGRAVLNEHHQIPNYENVYVVGDCASLPYAPSAQLAESQAEQIAEVLIKHWKGEQPPETLPKIKLKGTLGSLGKKQGFGLVADMPLTGRVPRLLKSGILWHYKFQNG